MDNEIAQHFQSHSPEYKNDFIQTLEVYCNAGAISDTEYEHMVSFIDTSNGVFF